MGTSHIGKPLPPSEYEQKTPQISVQYHEYVIREHVINYGLTVRFNYGAFCSRYTCWDWIKLPGASELVSASQVLEEGYFEGGEVLNKWCRFEVHELRRSLDTRQGLGRVGMGVY